jgi:hypothetical protein
MAQHSRDWFSALDLETQADYAERPEDEMAYSPTNYDIALLPPDDDTARWEQYEEQYAVQAVEVLADLLTETLPTGPTLPRAERAAVAMAVRTLLTELPTSTLLAWAANVDGVPSFEGWRE